MALLQSFGYINPSIYAIINNMFDGARSDPILLTANSDSDYAGEYRKMYTVQWFLDGYYITTLYGNDLSTSEGGELIDGLIQEILVLAWNGVSYSALYRLSDISISAKEFYLVGQTQDLDDDAIIWNTVFYEDDLFILSNLGGSVFGWFGNDEFIGGNGDDYIEGDQGNDTLAGWGGNDTLIGGKDNDLLFGGDGNDLMFGGSGDDYLDGGPGSDTIYDEDGGNDTLVGGLGDDFISSGFGDDALYGSDGNDTIQGREGNDSLYGEAGNDLLTGGEGENFLVGGSGNDTIDGGDGTDTVSYDGDQDSYTVTLGPSGVQVRDRRLDGNGTDTLTNIEFLEFDTGDFANFNLEQFGGATSLSEADFNGFIELYIAYFNRAPDAVGLNFWGTAYANGITMEQMAELFAPQPETLATYPEGTSNTEFATAVYNNVLGRIPDQAGFDFWVGVLDGEWVTRDQFILEVLRGVQDGSPDRSYLDNKVDVGAYFAVHKGMSDTGNAAAAMQLYDGTDASIQTVKQAIDAYHLEALDPVTGEFLLPLVGVLDDPFV